MFLRVRNTNETSVPLSVDLEATWTSVNGTIITNTDPSRFNYKNNATAITPQPLNLTNTNSGNGNGTWSLDVP